MSSKARELANLGNAYSDGALSNRNLIINGAMQVAQRGTSFTRTTSTYTLDRMEWVMNTSTCVISQSTDVPTGQGFASSLKVSPSVANNSLSASHVAYLRYGIEGQDLQQLAKGTSSAKSVTLSFWFKTNKVGTYQVNLRDHDNNRLVGQTFTPAASGTWEKFELVFDGDTTGAFSNSNARSLSIGWWFAAGTTYTSGSVPTNWETLNTADRAAGLTVNFLDNTSNELYLTGVQLEVGDTATPFEHRSYGQELALCQRYFQSTYNEGVAPGTATNVGGIYSSTSSQNNYAAIPIQFPVKLRATPTIVTYDDVGTSGKWHYSGNNRTTVASPMGASGGRIYVSNVDVGGEGARIGGHYTADSEL